MLLEILFLLKNFALFAPSKLLFNVKLGKFYLYKTLASIIRKNMGKIYDVIIIGGGPAGVGATVEANVLGLKDILLVEKGDNHSQPTRKFYKDNKR